MDDDDKPDTGDMVNARIADEVSEIMAGLEDCYNGLSKLGGWYNIVKMADPQGARTLIKFFFLMQEEWLNYGRGHDKIGIFGEVRDREPEGQINLDDIPY